MQSPIKQRSSTRILTTETPHVPGPANFDWPLANTAEDLLRKHISAFLDRNGFARVLAERMKNETGTDMFEWVDHLVLGPE